MTARARWWLPGSLIVLATAVGFYPILGNEFVNWDDQDTLYNNPDFNPPKLARLGFYWTHRKADLYVPVTYSAWWGIARVGWDGTRLRPAVFHAASLLCHITAALLVFAIGRRLVPDDWAAALGGLIFAVHPVQVEAVAWASGLKDVLSTMLGLAALWLLITRRGKLWLILATLAYALALLSKPSAVVIPILAGILLLLVRCNHWRVVGGWLLMAIPIGLIARHVQPAIETPAPAVWLRPVVALDAIGFYAVKLFWPLELGIDYGRTPAVALRSFGLAAVGAALMALAMVLHRRGQRLLSMAVAIFLASLLPILGFIPFDFQNYSTVADHYLYLAMLGPAVAVAWIASRSRLALCAAIAVTCACVVLSNRQARHWRDSEALFKHTLRVNSDSLAAHSTLAYLAATRNDLAEAESHYRAAVGAHPHAPTVSFNFANLLRRRGNATEAEALYRAAIGHRPAFAEAHNNLGTLLASRGELTEAREHFQAALRANPTYRDARLNLQRVTAQLNPPLPTTRPAD